jgi:hypothetical protein
MRVGDLIQILLECDQTAQVILASDPEGNDFFEVDEVSVDDAPYVDGQRGREVVVLWP